MTKQKTRKPAKMRFIDFKAIDRWVEQTIEDVKNREELASYDRTHDHRQEWALPC